MSVFELDVELEEPTFVAYQRGKSALEIRETERRGAWITSRDTMEVRR